MTSKTASTSAAAAAAAAPKTVTASVAAPTAASAGSSTSRMPTAAEIEAHAGLDAVEEKDTTPQPAIHVEERRLSLNDFLKTVVKINGSDIHLQAGQVPMIRVDGRARFLDCPPPTDDDDEGVRRRRSSSAQAGADRKRHDPRAQGRGRRRLLPARRWPASAPTSSTAARSYAIVMRRIVTKIPQLRRPEPAAAGREARRLPPRHRHRLRHDRLGQIDHAGGDHRQDQPHPRRADHHRRGPDRVPARERQVAGAARSRSGTDSESYEYALRAMMRQDPDTILIGEIRDTFSLTHRAARPPTPATWSSRPFTRPTRR